MKLLTWIGSSTKPYILSNEYNREKTIETLQETQAASNGFHMGFSCWENYDFIAARHSCGAVLADISTLAHEFHEASKECILASKDRKEFMERILLFLEKNPKYQRENDTAEAIRGELERNGSWLADDQSFSVIQGLYLSGWIFHIRLNITDREGFDAISEWLRRNGLKCDTFYLSNIPDWLIENDAQGKSMQRLKMAINRVLNRDSLVIHASEHFKEGVGMPQRVYQRFPYDPLAAIRTQI